MPDGVTPGPAVDPPVTPSGVTTVPDGVATAGESLPLRTTMVTTAAAAAINARPSVVTAPEGPDGGADPSGRVTALAPSWPTPSLAGEPADR